MSQGLCVLCVVGGKRSAWGRVNITESSQSGVPGVTLAAHLLFHLIQQPLKKPHEYFRGYQSIFYMLRAMFTPACLGSHSALGTVGFLQWPQWAAAGAQPGTEATLVTLHGSSGLWSCSLLLLDVVLEYRSSLVG